MSIPINPQYLANGITMDRLTILYRPFWNGLMWVPDPATVEVQAAVLLVNDDQPVIIHTQIFNYNDLPQMGKNRVNNARNYFEQRTADTYGP